MWKRSLPLLVATGAIAAVALVASSRKGPEKLAEVANPDAGAAPSVGGDEDDDMLSFRVPTGRPAELSCPDARRIIAQVRIDMLAYPPSPLAPTALASGVSDWMDPYGLWTAASDSPVADAIGILAPTLLREVEGSSGKCTAALSIGKTLVAWITELDGEIHRARGEGSSGDPRPWEEPLSEIARDDEPARSLANDLGHRLGAIERSLGPEAKPYVDAAIARYLPSLSEQEWSAVALAATVRAYVPLVDPHGAWAPDGEESSVYDLDLEAHPPERAWTKAKSTPIGVRIDEGALAPLGNGDVLLEVDGLATAALPPEQVDQLAFHAASADIGIVRVRAGATTIDRVTMVSPATDDEARADTPGLHVERVPFGNGGEVAIVTIPDVPDDLGSQLTRALLSATESPARTVGVVLDLRGNGGGSTEGAIDVLGAILPGAPLFPMKRRDGTLETDRAPTQAEAPFYRGPIATLVDPGTASAAEMIAGALGAYHRAPIMGTPTYGKGCAQEYADDAAHSGVLRLTTLLYALPDGSAVQRVGLRPWARVPFVAADVEPSDREATLPHAPPSWSGPDVRDADLVKKSEVPWPEPQGAIGPCKDAHVCDALAMLPSAVHPRERRGATARGR